MRREKTHKVPHRRRRENRTDYHQRLRLLRSGKPRLIIRKSLNNLVCQIVEYKQDGDRSLVTVYSADIKKLGWKGHCGNLPAAYLTGLLCGMGAKKHKITEAIVDAGLHTSTKGSAIYAALRGALDAGLKIPHSEDVLPPEDRVSGKHIEAFSVKAKKQDLSKQFLLIKNKILKKKG